MLIQRIKMLFFILFEAFSSANSSISDYLLPGNVIPWNYKIDFDHYNFNDRENKCFSGKVLINIKVLEPINDIKFHKKNLKIISYNLTEPNSAKTIGIQSENYDEKSDQFHLKFNQILDPGLYTLNIDYLGEYGETFGLIRRSSQKSPTYDFITGLLSWFSTPEWWIMASHMEPTYAREVFPCFDEPRFKATFEISVTHHKKFSALSNMPVLTKENISGNRWKTSFAKTPPMPTYTLAIVLHEFPSFNIGNDKNFTVYASPEYLKVVRPKFANAYDILRALENYTGINYALPKMDHVFVPNWNTDGFMLAMENWGLTIFVQTSNYDTNLNLLSRIIHEYTHQWFGNLVTPKWWSDTWLNEGFARLFSDFELKKFEIDDSTIIMKDIADSLDNLMEKEEEKTIGAVIKTPNSTASAIDSFDASSLNKAAFILHMIQHALSKKVFQKWIRNFLKKHEFGAVSTSDLYASFQDTIVNGNETLNIKDIMDTWLYQTSYPIINVTRDYEKKVVRISQQSRKSCTNKVSKTDCQWYVPLSFSDRSSRLINNTKAMIWLTPKNSITEFPITANSEDMLLFNLQTGYYRINYDSKNWKLISRHMRSPMEKFRNIPPLARIRLMRDALFFVQNNALDWKILLSLMDYLSMEDDIVLWEILLGQSSILNHFYSKFYSTKYRQLYQNHLVLCTLKTIRKKLSKIDASLPPVYREEISRLQLYLSNYNYKENTEVSKDNISKISKPKEELKPEDEKFIDDWLKSCPIPMSQHPR